MKARGEDIVIQNSSMRGTVRHSSQKLYSSHKVQWLNKLYIAWHKLKVKGAL